MKTNLLNCFLLIAFLFFSCTSKKANWNGNYKIELIDINNKIIRVGMEFDKAKSILTNYCSSIFFGDAEDPIRGYILSNGDAIFITPSSNTKNQKLLIKIQIITKIRLKTDNKENFEVSSIYLP